MSRFGLEERHWFLVDTLLVKPLLQRGCRVYVFGSRARGDHQRFSDLDVLIEGTVTAEMLRSIKDALEESNLPIKVDLVRAGDLADSYRTSVERDRTELL
jgi:predicted nucleotidyltransferase